MFSHFKTGLRPHDPVRVAAVKALAPVHAQDLLVDRVPKDWAQGLPWDDDDLGNADLGICGPAGAINYLKLVALACGRDKLVFTREDAEALYRALGWAGTAATDNGVVLLDLMEYWVRNPVAGFQLDCFFRIGYQDPTHLATALQFGPLLIGAELTETCMATDTWDAKAADDPLIRGGHCFLLLSDSPGGGNGKSWGYPVWNTPGFRTKKWREAYLPVCQALTGMPDKDLLRLLAIAKEL